MKKFTLLLVFQVFVVVAFAQEKLYVYENNGVVTEFYTSNVDSIAFSYDVVPYTPDDEDDVSLKLFSIDPVHKVVFSSGNLQYHPVKNEYRFAPNQTDCIGNENAKISATYDGWIDLFGWGTGCNPTNASTYYKDYSTFNDWGINKIGDDEPNTWRTPTYNEWYYLIIERKNASELMGVAQVNNVNGLVLLPDAWECPEGVVFKAGFVGYKDPSGYANYQVIKETDWQKMEEAGAVFLPAAGYRNGVKVSAVQSFGRYWAAYWHYDNSASALEINSARAEMGVTYCFDGESVRLISTAMY